MAGLTLDAGALIAAERNDRAFWALFKEALIRKVVPVVPAPALAQVYRAPSQARLSRLLKACLVEALDEAAAKQAGELCGRAKSSDVVDASVVASAARRGDAVATTDPKDLRRLASIVGSVHVIEI